MNAHSEATTVISLNGISKHFGSVEVLRSLDLNVERGAIHGLVGLNGSGKTTTLECILGLQQFQSGCATIFGFDPNELHRAEGDIVAVFCAGAYGATASPAAFLGHGPAAELLV